jgi:hypothetical protein
VLRDLETKKLYMLLGGGLEKHVATLADDYSYDQMLECVATVENGDWIRRCCFLLERRALGPLHLEARVNPRTRDSAPETV